MGQALAAFPAQPLDAIADHQPNDSAERFDAKIEPATMAARFQHLRNLEQCRRSDEQHGDEYQVPWIGQRKHKADDHQRGCPFELHRQG